MIFPSGLLLLFAATDVFHLLLLGFFLCYNGVFPAAY